jgi:hypothetical protein
VSVEGVFQPRVPEGFEWVVCGDERDFEVFHDFDGTPRRDTWTPVSVRILRHDEHGVRLSPAELPWLGSHVLVLTAMAANVLRRDLEPFGELLPLSCDDAELYVYNALRVIDALDEDHAELVRFSSGRILKIVRHAFRPAAVKDVHVFKIPQMLRGSIFVTTEIVAAARSAGLKGTEFEQIWFPDAIEAAGCGNS